MSFSKVYNEHFLDTLLDEKEEEELKFESEQTNILNIAMQRYDIFDIERKRKVVSPEVYQLSQVFEKWYNKLDMNHKIKFWLEKGKFRYTYETALKMFPVEEDYQILVYLMSTAGWPPEVSTEYFTRVCSENGSVMQEITSISKALSSNQFETQGARIKATEQLHTSMDQILDQNFSSVKKRKRDAAEEEEVMKMFQADEQKQTELSSLDFVR